jgi:hypothetical protein
MRVWLTAPASVSALGPAAGRNRPGAAPQRGSARSAHAPHHHNSRPVGSLRNGSSLTGRALATRRHRATTLCGINCGMIGPNTAISDSSRRTSGGANGVILASTNRNRWRGRRSTAAATSSPSAWCSTKCASTGLQIFYCRRTTSRKAVPYSLVGEA